MSRDTTRDPYTEILCLRKMLKRESIAHEYYESRTQLRGGGCYVVKDIKVPNAKDFILSVIQGNGTYGGEANKLEIMGLLTPREREVDSVMGGLSAEDVLRRIKSSVGAYRLRVSGRAKALKRSRLARPKTTKHGRQYKTRNNRCSR